MKIYVEVLCLIAPIHRVKVSASRTESCEKSSSTIITTGTHVEICLFSKDNPDLRKLNIWTINVFEFDEKQLFSWLSTVTIYI